MEHHIPLDEQDRADSPKQDATRDDGTREIAPDVAYRRIAIVNVIFFGPPNAGDRGWTLIDTGVLDMAGLIAGAAEERFGKNARPAAIVQTHGHFDHVGALLDLAERWDAPVYAHPLEMPFLNGSAAYPPPDPSVGGGMMARLSPLYPRGPIDVGARLRELPPDGSVPPMPGWEWIHTPGHTPGHVSLWRPSDGTLIAGDAFITTDQESAYSVLTQRPEMQGPPMYYTQDWGEARASVQKLAALEPERAVTGHGIAMEGPDLRAALHTLADSFDRYAVPEQGRYVKEPAGIGSGREYASK